LGLIASVAACGGGRDEAVYTGGPAPIGGAPMGDDGAMTEGEDDDDDDEMTTGEDMTTGDVPSDPSGDPPPGSDDGDPPPPGDSGGMDPSGGDNPADGCHAQATNACETCACDNCLSQLMACELDIGCVAIRICAQANNCTGIDCLGPCGTVIDNHGGPFGDAAGLATAVSDCVEGAGCGC
jgi:hypothetical protein